MAVFDMNEYRTACKQYAEHCAANLDLYRKCEEMWNKLDKGEREIVWGTEKTNYIPHIDVCMRARRK